MRVGRKNKLIRTYKVTDASVHDSAELDNVLDPRNDSQETWAKRAKGSVKRSLVEWRAEGDSAYRFDQQEARLKENGCPSNIHERAYRDQPLTPEQEAANTERSPVRVRVEHVFGHPETAMNGCYVRTISIARGIARAQAKIGLSGEETGKTA